MQVPFPIRQSPEEPKAVAGGSRGAVLVAAVGAAAPPAGLDPLGAPVTDDAMSLSLVLERNWRAVGDDGDGSER